MIRDFSGPDGAFPEGGVIADANGALYGTTTASSWDAGSGEGVLFKLVPPAPGQMIWPVTVLYYFNSLTGSKTVGELVRDPAGRFFGAAYLGGTGYGGTIYEITP
jgi:hypothetical protein